MSETAPTQTPQWRGDQGGIKKIPPQDCQYQNDDDAGGYQSLLQGSNYDTPGLDDQQSFAEGVRVDGLYGSHVLLQRPLIVEVLRREHLDPHAPILSRHALLQFFGNTLQIHRTRLQRTTKQAQPFRQ